MPKAQSRPTEKTRRDNTHDDNTHGIVLDEQSQEQPTDKDRARSAAITEDKEDEMQPLKEQSGF